MNIVADHLRLNEPSVVVWLAQSVELLEQADEEFEKAWRACGNRQVDIARFWGASDADLLDVRDGVIVAGLAKMHAFDVRDPAAMLKVADRASLTVIDEAHQAIAPTYSSVLTALQTKRQVNALLGLTATPGRTWSDIAEDKKLSDYFEGQKVALEVEGYDDPVTFLIDNGYLARPNFRVLCGTKIDLDNREFADVSRTQEVPDSFLEKLGRSAERNRVIVDAVRDLTTRHRRVLVFAPSVHSARLLRAILSMEGVEADFVSAETPGAERDRIVRKFRSGGTRPRVLLNFGVFTTGFDAPATSAAVIGRPTLSLVLYSQMVGRATRGPKAGGNAEAEILTVVDPDLPGFGSIAEAFMNWEDVWHERSC